MTDPDNVSGLFELEVENDGTVQVPEENAAKECCIISETGMVLGYEQVQRDGTVHIGEHHAGEEVQVVVPSDEEFEEHA